MCYLRRARKPADCGDDATAADQPGADKVGLKNCLQSLARAHGLSFAAFRYFNAAGAFAMAVLGKTMIQRRI